MTFPNAQKGVSKLFTSEILGIVAAVMMIIALILGVGSLSSAATAQTESALDGAVAGGLGTLALTSIASILFVVAYILQIVGLGQSAKDDDGMKTAFYCAIGLLIVNIVASCLQGFNPTVSSILQILTTVLSLLVTIYTILGITRMAEKLNDTEVANSGAFLIKLITVVIVLQLICSIISSLNGGNFSVVTIGTVIGTIMGIIVTVLQVVQFILLVRFLGKGKNMLAAK